MNTHPNEKCKTVANTPGSETLKHYKNNIFFYTSADNSKIFVTHEPKNVSDGGIYAVFNAQT